MIRTVFVCRGAQCALASFAVLVLSTAVRAAPQYDGSSNQLPTQQNWGYQAFNKANPLTAPLATAVAGSSVTTLDTTPQINDVAGFATHIPNLLSPGFQYTDPDVVPLDRTTGFELDFTVKMLSENHVSNDRAGFSVIALSNDATPQGIELGFWTNEVWAQNAGFTHGESSSTFDTTAGLINYRLDIQGANYTLFANNAQILTGALRDYTAFNSGPPFNTGFPYNQSNLTFFGDDTSSAAADVQISNFNVVPVPEPAGWALALESSAMAFVIFGIVAWRRYQPITMFDSMTLRARSKSSPVSCM
ncbi:MAG TPA: hypothetical protein VFE46_08555 [Pirellulales bacterium]|jgi:hypothetical protein|nr:hypothetical protein [Pirellulales bacterium]